MQQLSFITAEQKHRSLLAPHRKENFLTGIRPNNLFTKSNNDTLNSL